MILNIQTGNFTVVDPETGKAIPIIDAVAGSISQQVADGIVKALKNGSGFSIQEDSVEITVETTKEEPIAGAFIGRGQREDS